MQKQLGRYQIVRQIGQGAMGAVWLAKDPVMGREVAIKSILHGSSLGADARVRFEREARAAGALNHPNVVTVHEFGEDNGQMYLVMEYVKGEDLEALIRNGAISREEALEVLAQVCDALAEAHALGIIHRDIKPANVRVFRDGSRIKAKVMDFGVAVHTNSDMTADGSWMGTLSYMAPEYLDSGKASPFSDLFAVGVVLFEALSGGRKPFPGPTPSAVLNRLLLHPPETLLPGDLEGISPATLQIVQKALAKQAEARYGSAAELAADLRAARQVRWTGFQAPAQPRRVEPEPEPDDLIEESGPTWMEETPDPSEVLIVSLSGQGHYFSLGVALRKAAPGTRIFVMPGTYRESVIVDKPIEIIGNGNPEDIVIESTLGPCMSFRSSQALVANLTLRARAGGAEGPAFTAVDISEGEVHLEDCVLSSEAVAGMVVHGPGTHAYLRRCKVSECGGDGVLIGPGAFGTLERCQIWDVQGAGLRVSKDGRATLTHSRLHKALEAGILVEQGGGGRFEDCNLYRHGGAGIRLEGLTEASFLRCQIHDGEAFGVEALRGGTGTFEECDIFANLGSNVSLGGNSAPAFTRCKIHDGREYGILVTEGAGGTFEACEVFANRLSGLVISHGANPQLHHCDLSSGMGFGVQVTDEGRGLLDECEIRDHVMAGAKISRGGNPVFRRCQFLKGRDIGVHFAEGAKGILDQCQVRGNARGGLRIARGVEPLIQGGRITDSVDREGKLGMFGF